MKRKSSGSVSIGESRRQSLCIWGGKKLYNLFFNLFVYPIVYHLSALTGDDGFWVILNSVDGKGCMVEGHNMAFFVKSTDVEARREGVWIDNPRMVASHLYGKVETVVENIRVIHDRETAFVTVLGMS